MREEYYKYIRENGVEGILKCRMWNYDPYSLGGDRSN
jgi:hypothetical protein